MKLFGGSHQEQITLLPLDIIRVNPYQPRRVFDDDKLEELAISIKEVGLIQPITVRKIGKIYEIVAGERRFRAAKIAGLTEIPALIRQFTDKEIAGAALIENVQREDLNPIEEAIAYDRLLRDFDLTQEELAGRMGKSQSTIANKRRLLKLPKDVLELVMRKKLTERHARALLVLTGPELQSEVARTIIEKDYTVREATKYIESIMEGKAEERRQKKRRFVPKDVRIFVNTINGAIKTMQKAGIEAQVVKNETERYSEFTIRIPKG